MLVSVRVPTKVFAALTGGLSALGRYVGAHWPVVAILVLAVSLRLYWISHESPVLQGDECEYVRLAENLVNTHSYVGLFEGPQVMYPPLLPILIAAASQVMGSYEMAGELVTLLAGVLLVFAVFSLARYLYGSRVGCIAATLTACHPALIQLSGAIYSESLYVPLVVGGVFFGLWYLDTEGRGWAVASGACFGLAYLTRPEALVYPFVIVVVVMLMARGSRTPLGKALVKALPILVTTGALAVPYVAYLSIHTGGLRFEGKSVMNYTIGQRINAGMSRSEATLGIGPDLREEGPWLSPNRWVLEAPSAVPLGRLVAYWVPNAYRTRIDLKSDLLSLTFSSELELGLLTLGLLGHPWSRRRLIREAVILTIVLEHVFILLGQHYMSFRFVVPLLPFLLAWGAKGIDMATQWLETTAQNLTGGRFQIASRLAIGGQYGLILLMVGFGMRTLITNSGAFRGDTLQKRDLKETGIWLAQYKPGPKKIMSTSNEVPYYAKGTALRFPYAGAALTLEYIHAKAPDFIILTRWPSSVGKYYSDWFLNGLPDQEARLIHQIGQASEPQVMIYEWRRAN